jgi:hypothetical protein
MSFTNLHSITDGHLIIYRGCQVDGGKSDVCELIKEKSDALPGLTIDSCMLCKDDGCNKSTHPTPLSTRIISLFLALLLFIN